MRNRLKRITIVNAIIIAAAALTSFAWAGSSREKTNPAPVNGKGFAVLELFTSEGCSSCPPAEALLERIDREYKGKPVYILTYHVDYFDRLGWKDVFGSPENTRRQQKYSEWLNAQVYTPQLVVNGAQEFIGSYEADIRQAIATQLAATPAVNLSLHSQVNGNVIKISYAAKDIQGGEELLLGLVQKNGSTNVQRGENAGRLLSHIQVVRKTTTIPLRGAGTGSAELRIPDDLLSGPWEVIGMVQQRRTGAITAVASATPGQ